ncbi:MAG: hypothetical protein M1524_01520, partial [Patescibacteria group bacterium]|nr:hypothetical protein [Patescibacteria group bacterium]
MAKILSYNSPHHIQKEAEKENPLKKVWNWFSKQDRFVKGVIVVGFLLIIVTPAIVTQYFDIRQRAAGETASLYFTLHGTTSPLTTLSVKPGDDVLLDLYLSAPQTNINGLDITTVIPNNNTLVLSSPQTEGPDANKFNSLLFNSWQNNTWRFSKVTTDVNA